FCDAGGAAGALAQVVELRAANRAPHHDLDALDAWRGHREDALDTDAVRRLPHREHLAARAAGASQHGALEHLDPFLVTLDHSHVHANRVAGPEGGHVLALLLGLDAIDRVHGNAQSYRPLRSRSSMMAAAARTDRWLYGPAPAMGSRTSSTRSRTSAARPQPVPSRSNSGGPASASRARRAACVRRVGPPRADVAASLGRCPVSRSISEMAASTSGAWRTSARASRRVAL